MSSSTITKQSAQLGSFPTRHRWVKKATTGTKGASVIKVLIATNFNVPAGLKVAWKQIGCVSVAGYLQALTRVVAELKWEIGKTSRTAGGDMELLKAFGCAVQDRKRKTEKYSDAACRLLVSEGQDIDAADLDPDEAEAW